MNRYVVDKYASIAVVVLCIATFTVFGWYDLSEYDSIGFEDIYLGYNGGDRSFSWTAWGLMGHEIWSGDNFRLGNFICPMVTLFMPRWLWALSVGVSVGLTLLFIVRFIAPSDGRRVLATLLVWVLLVLFMPWRNCIFTVSYTLNYLLPAVLSVTFVWYWMNYGCNAERVAVILLAVLFGWSHEAFAVPVVCGALVWMMSCRVRKRIIPRFAWVSLGVLALTAFGVALCPGVLSRFCNEVVDGGGSINHSPGIRFYLDISLVIVLVAVVIMLALTRSGRARLGSLARNGGAVVFGVASVLAAVISVFVEHTPRSSFPAQLYALICLGIICMPVLRRVGGRVVAVCSAVLICALAVHAFHAAVWMRRCADQFAEISAQLRQCKGTVFYDIIDPGAVPVTTLYFPSRTSWIEPMTYTVFARALDSDSLAVVPTVFNTDLRRCPGVPAGDVMNKGGSFYISRLMDVPWVVTEMEVRLIDGTHASAGVFCLAFNDKAGNRWTYLRPHRFAPGQISEIYLSK